MLLMAIYDMELDKVQWLIEEGKSTMDSGLFLLALADENMDVDFAIVRWLISSGRVDAEKELGILLDQYLYITVPKLLRLVEIGEIDNIASDDAYIIWTKETTYTTDFLRIMLPRSNPPRRILKQLLKNEGREKNLVLQLMESSRYSVEQYEKEYRLLQRHHMDGVLQGDLSSTDRLTPWVSSVLHQTNLT
jgi:hypothetical protein